MAAGSGSCELLCCGSGMAEAAATPGFLRRPFQAQGTPGKVPNDRKIPLWGQLRFFFNKCIFRKKLRIYSFQKERN